MAIGDVNSSERGSGARYNDGKPDLSLIPWWALPTMQFTFDRVAECEALEVLGQFQRKQTPTRLYVLVESLYGQSGWVTALRDAARVFEYGAKKYAAWNWAKGMAWSVPVACAARHLLAGAEGEIIDPESGLPHTGHVVCNVLMLLHFMEHYPEGNDLPAAGCFGDMHEAGRMYDVMRRTYAYE
jgi:hypothetical protein